MALQTSPGHPEALQALASVRMSQQRPEEAKQCLEQAWTAWKDLDLGGRTYKNLMKLSIYVIISLKDDPKVPLIPARLALVKLFIELSLYTPALLVLHGIMSSDDQEVEAWYLEGWCFHLMSEQAQESGGSIDGLTWQELAKDSRDCLETCQVVSYIYKLPNECTNVQSSQSYIVIKTTTMDLYWNIPKNSLESWKAWASLRLL